jgi:hypothetical protein
LQREHPDGRDWIKRHIAATVISTTPSSLLPAITSAASSSGSGSCCAASGRRQALFGLQDGYCAGLQIILQDFDFLDQLVAGRGGLIR